MRPEKLEQEIREAVENGKKPSAGFLAETLDWKVQDVHRCLNILESRGRVETYRKEVLGREKRFAALKR